MTRLGAPASAGLLSAREAPRDALLLPPAQYRLLLEIGTSRWGREPRGTLVDRCRVYTAGVLCVRGLLEPAHGGDRHYRLSVEGEEALPAGAAGHLGAAADEDEQAAGGGSHRESSQCERSASIA